MVFEVTAECMNVFLFQFQTSKERKRDMRIGNDLNNFFVCVLIYVMITNFPSKSQI